MDLEEFDWNDIPSVPHHFKGWKDTKLPILNIHLNLNKFLNSECINEVFRPHKTWIRICLVTAKAGATFLNKKCSTQVKGTKLCSLPYLTSVTFSTFRVVVNLAPANVHELTTSTEKDGKKDSHYSYITSMFLKNPKHLTLDVDMCTNTARFCFLYTLHQV